MAQFTTSDRISMAAFEVTLMTAMKSYFAYFGCGECGFKQVRLEGTLDDWTLLKEKTEALA